MKRKKCGKCGKKKHVIAFKILSNDVDYSYSCIECNGGALITSKKCNKCKEVKPIKDFYKSTRLGGIQSSCKDCVKEYQIKHTAKVKSKKSREYMIKRIEADQVKAKKMFSAKVPDIFSKK